MHQDQHIIADLIDKRDYLGAYEHLQRVGATPEVAPGLWDTLGRRAREAGLGPLAETVQRALWGAGFRSFDLALDLARDGLENGRFGEAAQILEDTFGPSPEDGEARLLLARAVASAAPERALALLGDRVREDPRLALLAIDALRAADHLEAAHRSAENAVADFPDDHRVAVRAARVLETLNRVSVAEARWAAIGVRWPDQADLSGVQRVRLLLRLDRRAEALELAAALFQRPLPPMLRLQLAELLELEPVIAACLARFTEQRAEDVEGLAGWLHDRGMLGALAWLRPRGLSLTPEASRAVESLLDPGEAVALASGPLTSALAVRSPDILLPFPPETLSVFRTELTADQRGTRPVLICNATLSAGGAERQFVLLAEAIVAAGLPPSDLHVALFSLIGDRGHRHFLPPLERLGVTVHDLRAGAQDGARLGPATAAFLEALPEPLRSDSAALLALAARLQPRLIHGWQDRAGLAAGLAGLLLGTPRVVMSARNMRPQARGDRTRYARKLYAELARQPGMALTANSNPGARDYEDWLDLGLGQVSRLGNGLDIARFPVFPCEAGPDLTIGGVFRLAANKRPELWLRTVARLRDRLGAHIRPRLVGHGPLRGAILELAETLGLAPLDIAAHLTEPEEIYGGLDCLLLMSRVEGTPNVVLEAQACGLPVAACNVGGVADALAQGRAGGLLLPAEITAEAAAGQLMPWLETLHTPEGPAARRAFVAEGYSKAALRDRVMGLYGGALA